MSGHVYVLVEVWICVSRGMDLPLYAIFRLYFGTLPAAWYFCFLLYCLNTSQTSIIIIINIIMHGIVTIFRLLTQYFNMLNLIGKGNIVFDQNSHKSTQMNYYSYNAYVTPFLC